MSRTDSENQSDSVELEGRRTITPFFRAKVVLGGREIELGEFESEEEADQAISLAEHDWSQDLNDAMYPPKTRKCYNCEGTGKSKNADECNTCAGTGRVPV